MSKKKWQPIEALGGIPLGEVPEQTLAQWFQEEAERKNQLGEYFHRIGAQVGIPDAVPELNSDGSLKENT